MNELIFCLWSSNLGIIVKNKMDVLFRDLALVVCLNDRKGKDSKGGQYSETHLSSEKSGKIKILLPLVVFFRTKVGLVGQGI